MREHHDRLAGRAPPQIIRQPRQLRVAEIAEPPGLQVPHIVQPDEMHALLVEAVIRPARGTPPATVHSTPVPAHSMQLRAPLRPIPGASSMSLSPGAEMASWR